MAKKKENAISNDFLEVATDEKKLINPELKNLLHLDKNGMNSIISEVLERFNDGWIDDMDLFIYAKKGEFFFKTILDNIKDKINTSVVEKDYSKHNVSIVEKMNGVKYDFSECGDPIYNEFSEKLNSLKIEMKAREEFLKALKKPTQIIIEETSEVLEVKPPIKSGSMGLAATIK